MATTSSIQIAGKASAGQSGNGGNGRYGLKAKLAAGVAILSCAAALAFGGAQLGNQEQRQPQAAPSVASLPVGTDDLATTGCIGIAGPFACQVGQSLTGTDDFTTGGCVGTAGPFACATTFPAVTSGTDDLATNGCVGTGGPFACQTGQSLAGTDDFALIGCVQAPGPFACVATLPAITYGTDDLATNWCVGTAGPFACAAVPTTPAPDYDPSADH